MCERLCVVNKALTPLLFLALVHSVMMMMKGERERARKSDYVELIFRRSCSMGTGGLFSGSLSYFSKSVQVETVGWMMGLMLDLL